MNEKQRAFLDLFEKWNKSINLSAASTRAELQEHLDDSLHVVPLLRAHLLGGAPSTLAPENDAPHDASKLTPVRQPHLLGGAPSTLPPENDAPHDASKLTPVRQPPTLAPENDAPHDASKLTPVRQPRAVRQPRVLDVGSGGGFPVVVAAIELPEIGFTSLEPVHKKHAFLRTAARELVLPNLEPLARRLDDHDESDYDAAMSRATFDLAEWLAMGSKRVRVGGIVLGFEAITRGDLPPAVVRHPYALNGKQRAIVVLPKA